MTKDQKEISIFEEFRHLYNEQPILYFRKTESPDFIIEVPNKKIGLELTEVFQDSHKGPSVLQQKSSDRETFTNQLIRKLQEEIPFTFAIGIHFSDFYTINKAKRPALLNELKKITVPIISKLNNNEQITLGYYHGVPEEIDDLHIWRYDNMPESFNYKPEGGAIPNLTLEHLLRSISNKEKKLKSYTYCDEYWLLIREGNYMAGSFSDVDVDIPIESAFDKVFLLRTSYSTLLNLK